MQNWLDKITAFFVDLVKSIFTALLDLIKDMVMWVVGGILDAISALVAQIPAPTFLTTNSFGSILSGLPAFPLYIANQLDFGGALAIIGAGFAFYLARKLFTLGQW